MTKELSTAQQLNLPFEYDEYGINYEGAVYIGQQSMVDRLNQALGIENWELEPQEININMDTFSVSILGKLKVYDAVKDRWISRTQYGNDTMNIWTGEQEPRAQAIEDAKKSAMSDALKKCASWFGCGSDVFKGKIKGIKALKKDETDNPLYLTLINKFDLNRYDYKNGLVILPESYRSYYEEQGWKGIFESDLASAFSGGGSQPTGQSNGQQSTGQQDQNQQGNGNTNKNTNRGGKGNGRSQLNGKSGSNSSTSNNTPQQFRVKALSVPKVNQDGTAIFDALLESKENVPVIVPKELAKEAVNVVVPDFVLLVKGWLNGTTGVLKIAKNGKIEIEKPGHSKAS